DDPPVQGIIFGSSRHWRQVTIPPLNGPFVIITEMRKKTILVDRVFRLRHIIEPGIIHDRRRMPMRIHLGLAAEILPGYRRRRAEMMDQPQWRPCFMGRNE